jgi:hypothetical protein
MLAVKLKTIQKPAPKVKPRLTPSPTMEPGELLDYEKSWGFKVRKE